jgi:hypothetical protein
LPAAQPTPTPHRHRLFCNPDRRGVAFTARLAAVKDDQQELPRRGRWLQESRVAEVARRQKSRSPVPAVVAPEIRQSRNQPRRRRPRRVDESSAACFPRTAGRDACSIPANGARRARGGPPHRPRRVQPSAYARARRREPTRAKVRADAGDRFDRRAGHELAAPLATEKPRLDDAGAETLVLSG